MRPRLKPTRSLALFFTLAATALFPVARGGEGDAEADARARVAAAVSDMDTAQPDAIFTISRGLDPLGPAAVAYAKQAAATASPRARVGLARFLAAQKERGAALSALESAVLADDPVASPLAAELFGRLAQSKEDAKPLKAALEKVQEPRVKIAVAKALRIAARDVAGERVLKDYLESDDYDTRADAALALAEVGNIEVSRAVLAELRDEPTDRGKMARAYLEQDKLYESLRSTQGLDPAGRVKLLEKQKQELEKKVEELTRRLAAADEAPAAGGGGGVGLDPRSKELLDEIAKKIQAFYVDDDERIKVKELADAAAKGMVASLDPFSSYMTEKETKEFDDSMQGKYAGIGAVVSMDPKDKILTIIRPIYSGPAYRAGLRSLDKITEVEHEPTFGKTVEELVAKLKGEPSTPVRIKVYRKGWQKEREFTLLREEIQLESVRYVMMPGKIGYLSLSQFGQNAEREVEGALEDLESQGMRALVFDLRANPGGLLQAAVEIADKFLKDNKLIVYSEGRNPQIAARREFRTRDAATHPDYPVVVLVNHASASASEIVAGALQDWHRALLVGENTFGKGSVQQLMKVKATGEKSTLRLTIAKYYLPSGRCIHRDEKTGKGGVDPDIVVEMDSDPAWVIQEADKLMESQAIEKYVQGLWQNRKELVKELAVFDGMDASRYPGFDEWMATLDTKLDRERVRKLVRSVARRLVQDDRGKEFANDLEEDVQLQRGIYECLKKLGDDPSRYAEYAHFATKFAAKAAGPEPRGEVR
jgi:carboxyl-terminal processing protease